MKNLALISLFFLSFFARAVYIIPLDKDWQFKNTSDLSWQPATVPGVVHLDLLNNGVIEDPYYGMNEDKMRWIEKSDWEYTTTFEMDSLKLKQQHIDLVFEGLDTYASVYLNGTEVLSANNMFRQWEVDAKPYLKIGENKLRIVFHSPIKEHASTLEKAPYELPAANETVDIKVSPYTRKAAYHFGWDWGPRFVTCGVWRPVYFRIWNALKIESVQYTTEKISTTKARVNFEFEVLSDYERTYLLALGDSATNISVKEGVNLIKHTIEISSFKEWNPIGYGEQNIYRYGYGIYDNTIRLDGGEINVAIRDIEVVHEPDTIGTAFYFKVNDKPFFVKGANYIPQDMFLPRVDPARYERLIQQCVDANINMLRVWGGGIYENDLFYDLCDKYGILVWQDFMFANSMYPNDAAFRANIQAEVIENIKRLRNHPCIALWCGNNEIEVAWKNWGWQKQFGYSDRDSAEIWRNYESIFHEMIPETLKELDPFGNYVSTTPLSNWGKTEKFNHSTMHYWGVWHGGESIESFANNVGRFMTEYGYQSFPDYETLVKVLNTEDLSLESEAFNFRQKSYIGNDVIVDNIEKYTSDTINQYTIGLKAWIELSQLVQEYAYGFAIRNHRAKAPHCMGTLFWQLNDCWPGPSWSVIDYYGNEKAAYNAVKKYYASEIVNVTVDGESVRLDVLTDALNKQTINLSFKVINENGEELLTYTRDITLRALKNESYIIELEKKIAKQIRKGKNGIAFIVQLTKDGETIFTDQIDPQTNSTILFP